MDYQRDRVWELVQLVPWKGDAVIRLFWLRYSNARRDDFANSLATSVENERIIAIVVRKHSFFNANAVLSDVIDLLEDNKPSIQALTGIGVEKLTILLIARDEFRLVQASSEIVLPSWFPICADLERSFVISDLGQAAEESPLNCVEARTGSVSELLFAVESSMVAKLREVQAADPTRALQFLHALQMPGQPPISDSGPTLEGYETHIGSIADPRAYRPGADGRYLCARIIKLTLNSAPKQLGERALAVAATMPNSAALQLRPSFFAIAWRPAAAMTRAQANWHAVFVAMFQAYQMMNGSAHAGDYPTYSVALQHAMSLNVRSFLVQAQSFVEAQV
jgi:hypothetical protein